MGRNSFTQPGLFRQNGTDDAHFHSPLFTDVSEPGPQPLKLSPLSICNLASGSAGNATVIRVGEFNILIDAGIGPRTTAKRLKDTNLAVADIKAVFLTHLDSDHFRPTWINKLIAEQIPVFIHHSHLSHLRNVPGADRLENEDLIRLFDDQPFELLESVKVSTITLPHDNKGSTGYRLETPSGCVGFATDLGRVSEECVEFLANVNILAIESNYDYQMQVNSPRPPFLKDRIMNGYGHLCNDESFQAVCDIVAASSEREPEYIVLLHPSRQCNTPQRIRKVFEQNESIASRIILTNQSSRTDWIIVNTYNQ